MIPFAILSGNFIVHGEIGTEFCVQDLSVDSFTFRLPEPFAPGMFPDGFHLHSLHFSESIYENLILTDFVMCEEDPEELYDESPVSASTCETVPVNEEGNDNRIRETQASRLSSYCTYYRVTTESENFFHFSLRLQKEYQNYVRLKLSLPQAEVSRKLTGYPASEEAHFAGSWEKQRADLMASLHPDSGWSSLTLPPCGFLLDNPSVWNKYLSEDLNDFISGFFLHLGLSDHPLASCKPGYLYIGNSFCPQLFPDKSTLNSLLTKAATEHLTPVLVLAPATESVLSRYEILLKDYCACLSDVSSHFLFRNPIEIVVNDWGTLQLITELNQKNNFSVIPGTLLQKRKKDPRMQYSLSVKADPLSLQSHPWNADFYKNHLLSSYPLSGFLFETCGYKYQLPSFSGTTGEETFGQTKIHKDLILPFYQTNTATACTLRAAAANGNRGCPDNDRPCPYYCGKQVFLYPETLQMTGRYNSLFGFDRKSLEDSRYIESFLSQGIDRLVFQFL